MASKNELMGAPSIVATTTAASNTNTVVTVAAKSVTNLSMTTYITGIILSANGTITTANGVAPTLTNTQGGTLTLQIPAAAIGPIVMLFGVHPLRITPGTDAVLTLPALGVNVIGTATLLYYYGAE